jgi:hypothetical protein
MSKVVLVLIAMALPLGVASADVHAASKLTRYGQMKVCLTNIGWCTDYMKRTPESTSCVCRNHQQNPGHVTSRLTILSTVPEID